MTRSSTSRARARSTPRRPAEKHRCFKLGLEAGRRSDVLAEARLDEGAAERRAVVPEENLGDKVRSIRAMASVES
jgi:uncharacterized membrane protein